MDKLENTNFIERDIIESIARGETIITRYPPEPNGYMHIGHAKAFYLDWLMAKKYGGYTNLRFDDTNPEKEDMEYVNAMQRDMKWLGLEWKQVLFASDYYEQLYEMAQSLIKKGLAYVDFQTADEIKENRGNLQSPGIESPYRATSAEVNLAEFAKMRAGDYPDGHCVLRAKIDMSSGNMCMRDPVIYRIMRVPHYRTGTKWLIYPLYDFAHPLSDAIEGITHSICSLEFEARRPLYDWFIEHAWQGKSRPRQFEFSRINIEQTVMSKRYLKKLVDAGRVDGWDDPRMPTISGLRRRGYPPGAIIDFVASTGVSRTPMTVPLSALEFYVRSHLDKSAPRINIVFNPIKVIIINDNNREVLIEADDFSETPPKGWKRLSPVNTESNGTVRLRELYIIKFERAIKDKKGQIKHLECTMVENSRSGNDTSGIKPNGTIHWVNSAEGVSVIVNEFFPLLKQGTSLDENNFTEITKVTTTAIAEPKIFEISETFQAVRKGFFIKDPTSSPKKIIINKTVGLKEGW